MFAAVASWGTSQQVAEPPRSSDLGSSFSADIEWNAFVRNDNRTLGSGRSAKLRLPTFALLMELSRTKLFVSYFAVLRPDVTLWLRLPSSASGN
jgi:hypothetical protein